MASSALEPLCSEQITRIVCSYSTGLVDFILSPLYFVARGDFGSCHSKSQFDQMTTFIRELVCSAGPNEPAEIKQTTVISDNSSAITPTRLLLIISRGTVAQIANKSI